MRQYAVPLVVAFAIVVSLALYAGTRRELASPPSGVQRMEKVMVAVDQGAAVAGTVRAAAVHGHAAAPQIARTGKVDLLVSDAQTAVGVLSAVARRSGGDVFALQVSGASDSTPASAVMQLRVPADRFDATMDAVARTGKVRQQSEAASDLTGDINDSGAQLRNLQNTEADLRKIMDRSGDVDEILNVETQLSQVREQIETLESSLKTMREQVIYSTIDVSLSAETGNVPVEPPALSQLGNALRGAWHAFTQSGVAILSALVWLLVFAPYLAIIAAIGWLAARRLRLVRP